MCEPTAIIAGIGAVASAAGAYSTQQSSNAAIKANQNAQSAEIARRARAQADERARQATFDKRSQDVVAETLSRNRPEATEGDQDAAAALRSRVAEAAVAKAGEGAGPAENPVLMPTAAASGTTVADAARAVSSRLADARKSTLASAFLQGTKDAQGAQNRGLQTAASDMATLQSQRRGSLNAYGIDLNRQTETFSATPSMLGDAATAAGQLAMNYAGRQAGKAQANGTPSSFWG
jgi:hypothetical protein